MWHSCRLSLADWGELQGLVFHFFQVSPLIRFAQPLWLISNGQNDHENGVSATKWLRHKLFSQRRPVHSKWSWINHKAWIKFEIWSSFYAIGARLGLVESIYKLLEENKRAWGDDQRRQRVRLVKADIARCEHVLSNDCDLRNSPQSRQNKSGCYWITNLRIITRKYWVRNSQRNGVQLIVIRSCVKLRQLIRWSSASVFTERSSSVLLEFNKTWVEWVSWKHFVWSQ